VNGFKVEEQPPRQGLPSRRSRVNFPSGFFANASFFWFCPPLLLALAPLIFRLFEKTTLHIPLLPLIPSSFDHAAHNVPCLSEPRPNEGPPQGDDGAGGPPPGGLTDADLESNWDEAIESFDGMDLPEELLRGIYSYGFEKPSAIQQRAVKPTMMGRDLIAQAQSGTVRILQIGGMEGNRRVGAAH
jgi:hypothetical protein